MARGLAGGDFGGTVPDDTGCHILHADMDAFYASVEISTGRNRAGRPSGGPSSRSVVLSASYPGAGLRGPVGDAHDPGRRGWARGPWIIPPRHRLYAAVSREVMAVFRSITPEVEPLALDEAFLDVSGALRRLGAAGDIGQLIRAQISEQQDITCSVGVATSKFIAKLASAAASRTACSVIPADGVLDFLHPLPVAALWGVGKQTGQVLARLGLRTVADIAHTPVGTLERELGQAAAAHLSALAAGRDERRVVPGAQEKSIGAEETFPADVLRSRR